MEEGKENMRYSAEDIRKYYEGKLSDREMQAMEKAALEDPFLADAMEGLEESRRLSVPFDTDMSDLQKRLAERISVKKRKKGMLLLISNWKVAASVLVVVGTALFTFMIIDSKSRKTNIATTIKQDSAVNREKSSENSVSDTLSTDKISSAQAGVQGDSAAITFEPAKSEKKSRTQKAIKIRQPQEDENFQSLSRDTKVELKTDSADKIGQTSDLAKNTHQIPAAAPVKTTESLLSGNAAGISISKQQMVRGNYVQGLVLDDSNKPVSFATVNVAGTNEATSTNDDGYFKLYLKNSNSAKLVINSVGFQTVSAKIKADSSSIQKFRMQPSTSSLNDVVVIGYGSENSEEVHEAFQEKEKKQVAAPIGWDSLINYININKKIPGADSALKGDEIISFIVSNKGELYSFNVIKSISPVHDATVIRLIKSGPALKLRKGKKQVCQLTIVYN